MLTLFHFQQIMPDVLLPAFSVFIIIILKSGFSHEEKCFYINQGDWRLSCWVYSGKRSIRLIDIIGIKGYGINAEKYWTEKRLAMMKAHRFFLFLMWAFRCILIVISLWISPNFTFCQILPLRLVLNIWCQQAAVLVGGLCSKRSGMSYFPLSDLLMIKN